MTFATLLEPGANQGIGIAFTDRWGGVSDPPYDSFNLGRDGQDDPAHLRKNFAILAAAIRCDKLAICAQVHGTQVAPVDSGFACVTALGTWPDKARLPQADALMTTVPGVALMMRVADCVPVLLADPGVRVVAAVHAGRVGLVAGVIPAAVHALRSAGAREIRAWIGPHICAACYEVPEAMATRAWELVPDSQAVSRTGTPAINLGGGAAAQLAAEGVETRRVDPCTACDGRFFSHRRDQGSTGRQAGVIWLEK